MYALSYVKFSQLVVIDYLWSVVDGLCTCFCALRVTPVAYSAQTLRSLNLLRNVEVLLGRNLSCNFQTSVWTTLLYRYRCTVYEQCLVSRTLEYFWASGTQLLGELS